MNEKCTDAMCEYEDPSQPVHPRRLSTNFSSGAGCSKHR